MSCTAQSKGGAAVLLRVDTFGDVTVIVDRHKGNLLDGGVCVVDTTLGGNKLRLASVCRGTPWGKENVSFRSRKRKYSHA